ncbi:unnamed protein product [Ostreobium quekettii]|uniref:Uncharacterized protein n=1 Tax=Ostreobium quekettii TaxID=121088 RepID=A0A8S1IQU8_9CHLO|nr:unnamed protein product [Ostreobium quekettii]
MWQNLRSCHVCCELPVSLDFSMLDLLVGVVVWEPGEGRSMRVLAGSAKSWQAVVVCHHMRMHTNHAESSWVWHLAPREGVWNKRLSTERARLQRADGAWDRKGGGINSLGGHQVLPVLLIFDRPICNIGFA